jgi:CubicO group peptidase (beta-lactamase class C family)
MDSKWAGVTFDQLLAHRGGAPNSLSKDRLWLELVQQKGTPTEQRMQLLEGVLKHPPEHEPGTEHEYSNAGFAIAGAMLERLTGKAWEHLMRERVFQPLGMASAGFGAPGSPNIVDQPWGHTVDGDGVRPGKRADNPPAIGPAGTVHMTMTDWAKYIGQHTSGEKADRDAKLTWLLKPETFQHLHAAYPGKGSQYGGGWSITRRAWAKGEGGDGRVITHTGSNTMWFCVAWLAPECDMAVLVCCNKGGDKAAKACDDAAAEMIKRFFDETK